MFGLTIVEWVMIVTAFGGGTTLQAIISAIKARHEGAQSREIEQGRSMAAEMNRAHQRLVDLEIELEKRTKSRNEWREVAHLLDIWCARNCAAPRTDYPTFPQDYT